MEKNMQKPKPVFKKFLIIYVIILAILMLVFLAYVADSLIKYEKNQIDNYMESVIANLKNVKKGKVDTSSIKVSEFEKTGTSVESGIKELLNSKEITYKPQDETTNTEKPIYDIYVNEEKVIEVRLNGTKKENRLGLLTFNKWETEKIEAKAENGLYNCVISAPSDCKVYVNNKELTEAQIVENEQNEGLTQISKYVEIPYIINYEIPNLLKEPEVKILDKNGAEIQYEKEGNKISKALEFKSVGTEEEAKQHITGEIDAMKVAKDWSLYLTDDLEGRLHGFYNISKYLIEDSDIENFAYKWATGVDITFVSSHRLDKPTFQDEKLSNFEIYNEKAFSCEVYLQKNLRLTS